jgi:hypothetical protein
VAHHLMSKDGVTDWKDMGVAYDPRRNFVRYTDGTVNKWNNMERPGVVIENGHVTHFTFAVTDIDKSSVTGTDNHGSKIVVVPFDGKAFDADNGGETDAGERGGATVPGGAAGYLKISPQSNYGSSVAIEYAVPHSGQVAVTMYNLTGREISSLVNRHLEAGSYRYLLNTYAYTRGCYAVRLQAGTHSCITTIQIVH